MDTSIYFYTCYTDDYLSNMRQPIIAGNWKMYKTATEAVKLVKL